MWFILNNQKKLRSDTVQGITDAVDLGFVDGCDVGKSIICLLAILVAGVISRKNSKMLLTLRVCMVLLIYFLLSLAIPNGPRLQRLFCLNLERKLMIGLTLLFVFTT